MHVPLVQVSPAQQACPSPPHASHVPPLQIPPASQASPVQHADPTAPHGAGPASIPSQTESMIPQSLMRYEPPPQVHVEPTHSAALGVSRQQAELPENPG